MLLLLTQNQLIIPGVQPKEMGIEEQNNSQEAKYGSHKTLRVLSTTIFSLFLRSSRDRHFAQLKENPPSSILGLDEDNTIFITFTPVAITLKRNLSIGGTRIPPPEARHKGETETLDFKGKSPCRKACY